MNLTLVSILLAALTAYSYLLVRQSGTVQYNVLLPFLQRLHMPNILNTLTEEEHDGIHRQIDIFSFRVLSILISSVIAVGVSLMFIILAANGGDATTPGYVMAVAFAYVAANYNINSQIINWVYSSENELLARVIQDNADKGGFKSLVDYLDHENTELLKDWQKEVVKVGEAFEARLIELGYDPDRDYLESPAAEEELTRLLEQVTNEFEEKHGKPPGL